MSRRILGLDQGTTSTRILELAEGASPRILHAVRQSQHHPGPGWCEQDPEELILNLEACLSAAGEGAAAIGLANQGESCLAWDARNGRPLSPAITWQDKRTVARIERLAAEGAEEMTLARAGLPLDPYFSASKLAWILSECSEAKAALRNGTLRLGTTDAFFLDRLAGVFATDATTASRTSLMDIATGTWDETLCGLFGVPIECLPEIRPTIGDFGSIGDTPIRASVVDQQAALWGHGCREAGETKITFGTGAFALMLTGGTLVPRPGRGLLPTIAWSNAHTRVNALEGGVYDAGSAIEWAQSIGLVRGLGELASFDLPSAISRGLTFVPALSGLACPHWDRSAAALWIGISAATTRTDLIQSMLEGIALRTGEVVEAMASHVPISGPISVDGGLSRSPYFCQFLADIIGLEICVPSFDELTALGCASMAGSTLPDVHIEAIGISARFLPRDVPRHERKARFSDAVGRSRAWS